LYLYNIMADAKRKGGRPRKHHTEEAAREAAAAASRASRRRKRESQPRVNNDTELNILFDPRSILQQAGPEGDAHITAPESGILAEGLNIPFDDEQRELLQVDIGSRFPSTNISLT
jgi:hypothetical protein